jgi:hypothetical protein
VLRLRPVAERTRGAATPVAHGPSVALPLDGEQHDLPLDLRSIEALELLEALDDHDLGLDRFRSRADAVAQAEHGQLASHRLDQLQRLVPAHPVTNVDRLKTRREPLLAHQSMSPLDGLLELRGAAQAMADRGGQVKEFFPAGLVGERRSQDLARGRAVLLGEIGVFGVHGKGRSRGQEYERRQSGLTRTDSQHCRGPPEAAE